MRQMHRIIRNSLTFAGVLLLLLGCATSTGKPGSTPSAAVVENGLTDVAQQNRAAGVIRLVEMVRAGRHARPQDTATQAPALANVAPVSFSAPVFASAGRLVAAAATTRPAAASAGETAWPLVLSVRFAPGFATLSAEDHELLAALARVHRQQGGPVRIVGYADGEESTELADERAGAVVRALATNGVLPSHLAGSARSQLPATVALAPSAAGTERRADIYWRPGAAAIPAPVPVTALPVVASIAPQPTDPAPLPMVTAANPAPATSTLDASVPPRDATPVELTASLTPMVASIAPQPADPAPLPMATAATPAPAASTPETSVPARDAAPVELTASLTPMVASAAASRSALAEPVSSSTPDEPAQDSADVPGTHVATFNFDYLSVDLRPDDAPLLRSIAQLQREHGGRVRVVCPPSSGGFAKARTESQRKAIARANQLYAERRGAAVAAALTAEGVAPEQIVVSDGVVSPTPGDESASTPTSQGRLAEIYIDLPGAVRLAEAAGVQPR